MALKKKKKAEEYVLPDVVRVDDASKYVSLKNEDITQETARAVIVSCVKCFETALLEGKSIQIPGVCKIEVSERAARKGRNPKTGESIDIAARRTVHFKLGATLKKKLNEE